MTDILELFSQGPLVSDGASGTLLETLSGDKNLRLTMVPLENPALLETMHRNYIDAGSMLLKTHTFSASAREVQAASLAAGSGAFELSKSLSLEACRIAVRVRDRAGDGKRRLVLASVGPGSLAPSLGSGSHEELVASYTPQIEGFIEGGADIVLVETIQDTIQAKAVVMAIYRQAEKTGRLLPFILSATMDASGRMLCGATAGSFAAIMAPFNPLALGVNCSGGPKELEKTLKELATASPVPLCFMPNAGMPTMVDGKAHWPMKADEFATIVRRIAAENRVAICGGCCGTGPEHIGALSDAVKGAGWEPSTRDRPRRTFGIASITKTSGNTSELVIIDERANASGSAAFKKLLKNDETDKAVQFIVDRAQRNVAGVDLCVAGSGKEDVELLPLLARAASPLMSAALSLDSLEPQALEKTLPWMGGRPLINSVNLEEPNKARRVMQLARAYGAALVLLAVDENGPARTVEAKLDVCSRLFAMAREEGLKAQDLAFDACTIPAAAGDDRAAVETLDAVAALKKLYPDTATILGVGNVSFGLPKALRPFFTQRFLMMARERGLDAAIVDSSIPSLTMDEKVKTAIDRALLGGGSDAFQELLDLFNSLAGEEVPAKQEEEPDAQRSPLERLAWVIEGGRLSEAVSVGIAAVESGADESSLAHTVTKAMLNLARRYDEGRVALPVVMRSADAAKLALEAAKKHAPTQSATDKSAAPIIMATVKGDLHDIGKNLAGLVFEAAGYRIIDLGTDREPAEIIQAAVEHHALAVGVSGLLTRSLGEMEKLAAELEKAKLPVLLLCGGAAVSQEYIDERVKPLREGQTSWAKDPFSALPLLEDAYSGLRSDPNSGGQTSLGTGSPFGYKKGQPPQEKAPGTPEPAGTFPGSDLKTGRFSLDELLPIMDEHFIIRGRWKYPLDEGDAGREALNETIEAIRKTGPRYAAFSWTIADIFAFGQDGRLFRSADRERELSLIFMRQPFAARLSLADWFQDGRKVGLFAVTMGHEAGQWAKEERGRAGTEAYVHAYGILAGLAEAAAELCHRRIKAEMGGVAGKRYSFGFPGCPGTQYNQKLLDFLNAGSIGLSATSSGELAPEFSVSAIVSPDPDSGYLGLT